MLINVYNIDEIDPKDPTRRVHLTLQNVRSNNFAPKQRQVNKKSDFSAKRLYENIYKGRNTEKSYNKEKRKYICSGKQSKSKRKQTAVTAENTAIPTSDFEKK